MMYDNKTTAAAVATSTPITLGIGTNNWDVGYQVVATGTITYNVEVSIDGTNFVPLATATGLTASAAGELTFPCKFVRVNNTAGTGGTTLIILEVR